ncbi:sugar transferase [Belliella kenyensis]|uniref:Sugar transferase n=1 Tax=Belliella kenyensis TaxID=1472724 RepID=A0ABV8EIH1_9BACT|nr:sugar transferase [Belliella kenyensis]MCH7401749.1 sugar transferase [Belliella kenyensis]MDN3604248.1 sugar transferase [Belliella kenyensis]
MYSRIGKRIFDLLLAGFLALVFFPFFLLIWILTSINNHGQSAFFYQERPGLNGQIFQIIKFKTMRDAYDSLGNPLPDSQRITKFGRIVRRTSLDELPQLFNVLVGDMSVVGPRPLLVEYLTLYDMNQKQRHLVKPGITGWAQINGRNAIDWCSKFEFDVWYVHHVSFLLDVKILLITFFNVLQGKGVTQQGHVTVGKFKGNQPLTE